MKSGNAKNAGIKNSAPSASKRAAPDDRAQSKRFLEAAREAEADEKEEGADRAAREENDRGLRNLTPGFFGYSLLRAGVHDEYYRGLLEMCEQMRLPLEGLHTETGPGVIEAAIQYSDRVTTD